MSVHESTTSRSGGAAIDAKYICRSCAAVMYFRPMRPNASSASSWTSSEDLELWERRTFLSLSPPPPRSRDKGCQMHTVHPRVSETGTGRCHARQLAFRHELCNSDTAGPDANVFEIPKTARFLARYVKSGD